MISKYLLAVAAILRASVACPDHINTDAKGVLRPRSASSSWTYDDSYDWGTVIEGDTLCRTGTKQSPVELSLAQGLSQNYKLDFNYERESSGNLYNWGYGPAFDLAIRRNSSVSFNGQTAYLRGWHIHTPSEHLVDGRRSMAEAHFVHEDLDGTATAVLALRIDPGQTKNAFFSQLAPVIGVNDTDAREPATLDLTQVLEHGSFNNFWTYNGSLTTPPCTEGIRWFVASEPIRLETEQMQDILRTSKFSARVTQQVWQHGINGQ